VPRRDRSGTSGAREGSVLPLFRRRRGHADDARRPLGERLNHLAQDVLDGDLLLPSTRSHARDEELARTGEAVEAIEGVTLERWAQVEAALTVARVPPAEQDAVATRDHRVPAGRWSAIRDAWMVRQVADWRIGAAFGEAYAAASEEARHRRKAERRR